jgi:hypothetical protein
LISRFPVPRSVRCLKQLLVSPSAASPLSASPPPPLLDPRALATLTSVCRTFRDDVFSDRAFWASLEVRVRGAGAHPPARASFLDFASRRLPAAPGLIALTDFSPQPGAWSAVYDLARALDAQLRPRCAEGTSARLRISFNLFVSSMGQAPSAAASGAPSVISARIAYDPLYEASAGNLLRHLPNLEDLDLYLAGAIVEGAVEAALVSANTALTRLSLGRTGAPCEGLRRAPRALEPLSLLRDLSICLHEDLDTPFLPPSLTRLCIGEPGEGSVANAPPNVIPLPPLDISGRTVRSLTALQRLEVHSECSSSFDALELPPSLTHLSMRLFVADPAPFFRSWSSLFRCTRLEELTLTLRGGERSNPADTHRLPDTLLDLVCLRALRLSIDPRGRRLTLTLPALYSLPNLRTLALGAETLHIDGRPPACGVVFTPTVAAAAGGGHAGEGAGEPVAAAAEVPLGVGEEVGMPAP